MSMGGNRFPISKIPLIWNLTFRLIITILIGWWGYGIVISFSNDPVALVLLLLIFIFMLLIIWIPFLRMTYEVILDETQIIFKSLIRTVRMEVSELISIKDEKGGRYTRFRSEKSSILMPSRIKRAEELDSIVKSINPRAQIQHLSKSKKILRPFVGIAAVLLILVGMLWCSDPRMFGDRQRAVKAVQKYHEIYGKYPKDLSEVKDKIKDIQFKSSYRYRTDGTSFTLSYTGGLSDKGASYDSRTQEWKELHH
jgi:hypothetical protein